MQYTAIFKGLTIEQKKESLSILFNLLSEYLSAKQKNSHFQYDKKNFKIIKKGKTFFYYNLTKELLETDYPKHCQESFITICKDRTILFQYISFFQQLTFSSSETEAYMLSDNSLLLSKTPRIYDAKNKKIILSYNGIVSAEFGLKKIFSENTGLVFGSADTDFFFYCMLSKLLPTFKEEGLKMIYLQLNYSIFSSFFNRFNKKKERGIMYLILKELKKKNSYGKNNSPIKNFRKLLMAAKKADIDIQAYDVSSSFSTKPVNPIEKLKTHHNCMIRSIEKLQYDHSQPKFFVLVGLSHAIGIAQELGIPSCFIGHKQELQKYSAFTKQLDYFYLRQNKALYSFEKNFISTLNYRRHDQKEDPKINTIIAFWDKLTQNNRRIFSMIPIQEIKQAKEVYIEYILGLSTDKNEILDICESSQKWVIQRLNKAIYPKFIELAHPKNWFLLFHCQRPYGIRLAENEIGAFTKRHLINDGSRTNRMKFYYP